MGIEKRDYTRRYFSDKELLFFVYKLKDKLLGRKNVALTLNLSATGLLFRAADHLALNSILKGVLKIPNLKREIKLEAQVVRVDATDREGIYDIAVYFTKIDKGEIERAEETYSRE